MLEGPLMIGFRIVRAGGVVKQPNAVLNAAEVHVHFVSRPLQPEDRRITPLIEQQIAGVEESRDAHDEEKQGHGNGQ